MTSIRIQRLLIVFLAPVLLAAVVPFALAQANGRLYRLHDPTPERRALADAAIDQAMRLQPDLPEVHLAYAILLYHGYRDYERARVQLRIELV